MFPCATHSNYVLETSWHHRGERYVDAWVTQQGRYGTAGVWCFRVECTVITGMDLSYWITPSASNVTWTKWSNLSSCPAGKVMGWHFSRTPFLSQFASHRTSLIKCSPYTALASIFTTLYPIEHWRRTSLIARSDRMTHLRKPWCSYAW